MLNVHHRFFFGGKFTGALEHQVHLMLAPRGLQRIARRIHFDAITIDQHMITIDGDCTGKTPMRGVVLGEMSIDINITHRIDGDNFDVALAI